MSSNFRQRGFGKSLPWNLCCPGAGEHSQCTGIWGWCQPKSGVEEEQRLLLGPGKLWKQSWCCLSSRRGRALSVPAQDRDSHPGLVLEEPSPAQLCLPRAALGSLPSALPGRATIPTHPELPPRPEQLQFPKKSLNNPAEASLGAGVAGPWLLRFPAGQSLAALSQFQHCQP